MSRVRAIGGQGIGLVWLSCSHIVYGFGTKSSHGTMGNLGIGLQWNRTDSARRPRCIVQTPAINLNSPDEESFAVDQIVGRRPHSGTLRAGPVLNPDRVGLVVPDT